MEQNTNDSRNLVFVRTMSIINESLAEEFCDSSCFNNSQSFTSFGCPLITESVANIADEESISLPQVGTESIRMDKGNFASWTVLKNLTKRET